MSKKFTFKPSIIMIALIAGCAGEEEIEDYTVNEPYGASRPVHYISETSKPAVFARARQHCPNGYRALKGPYNISEGSYDLFYGEFICEGAV